jgi:hypothetical protein
MTSLMIRILTQAASLEQDEVINETLTEALAQQEDLDQFIVLAKEEGLACFLYRSLKRSKCLEILPPQTTQDLRKLYEQTVLFNLRLIHDLKEILSRLNREGIRVVLLQGMALVNQIYRDGIGLRPMTDIDLWVRGPQYNRVTELLRGFGYERDQVYSNIFARGSTTFDLHSHVIWADRIRARRHLLLGGQDAIYQEVVTIDFEGEEALVLSPSDQVLYLSLHAFKHNLKRLIWLVDIALLLQHLDPSGWAALIRRAGSLGLKRHLGYALYLLNQLFHIDPPSGVFRSIDIGSMGLIEKRLLQRRVRGNRLPSWSPLFLLLPRNGLTTRISYLLESSLPRKEILNQVFVDYPDMRRCQLYRMRILQLFGKIRLALKGL